MILTMPLINETIVDSAPQGFHDSSWFGTLCEMVTSVLPLRFSFTQQVHVKLKAESTVIFVFYIVKQIQMHWRQWRAEKEQKVRRPTKAETRRDRKMRKRDRKKVKRKQQ